MGVDEWLWCCKKWAALVAKLRPMWDLMLDRECRQRDAEMGAAAAEAAAAAGSRGGAPQQKRQRHAGHGDVDLVASGSATGSGLVRQACSQGGQTAGAGATASTSAATAPASALHLAGTPSLLPLLPARVVGFEGGAEGAGHATSPSDPPLQPLVPDPQSGQGPLGQGQVTMPPAPYPLRSRQAHKQPPPRAPPSQGKRKARGGGGGRRRKVKAGEAGDGVEGEGESFAVAENGIRSVRLKVRDGVPRDPAGLLTEDLKEDDCWLQFQVEWVPPGNGR